MTAEIRCECGFIVKGKSENHAKSNMKTHKKSRLHKRLIKTKKEER
jgi:hypothetical protein